MKLEIYVDRAKEINEGDKFRAVVKYVEGRKIVELIPTDAETIEDVLEIIRDALLEHKKRDQDG